MKIYIDDSALNRLLDDRRTPEVKYDRELMVMLVEIIEKGGLELVGSEVLDKQIKETEDVFKETVLEVIYSMSTEEVKVDKGILERAEEIRRKLNGIQYIDSLHIACAEAGEVDAMVTADTRLALLSKGIKLKTRLLILPQMFTEVLK
ncbi:MAG: PIN domain-containing protein [Lachnospiraceae bacterium]|nr:PIN domain-containing protein [Lachnospiraceae bacterium]